MSSESNHVASENTKVNHKVESSVSEYYGKILKKTDDLKTNACTTCGAPPQFMKELLSNVHDEVMAKYYGCGIVAPEALVGKRVLDLGCGSGRDVYAIAQLVGELGEVVGVDMTDEQLEVAIKHQEWHREKFGFKKSNTSFHNGYIEKLDELGFADSSFDVIISNCVINLSPDKKSVLRQVHRLLKPGGEMYFSDVYSNRRVPESLRSDKVLWGECLSGALYWNDFIAMAKEAGFIDPRVVESAPITINNRELEAKIGHINFFSATCRLWKIAKLESECEDYGQAVIYKGTIPQYPRRFLLDSHHSIESGKVFPVCGNTFRMLHETRLASHFTFIGTFDEHFGIFEGCGSTLPFSKSIGNNDQNCC